jgi:hypothetical protein
MVGGKRDAHAADLENHDTPVTAAVTDVVASFLLAPVVFDLTTLEGILVLIETPLMNLIGTPYLNICIILRFIYTAILKGANLNHHEV